MTDHATKIPPLLLTPRQAARILSISERTLWGSDIPKVRIGKRGVRYHVDDLKAWIETQKTCCAVNTRDEPTAPGQGTPSARVSAGG